jgi:ABC-2 type transport system permease protein
MKKIIAKKEILQAFRDKRFWIIAVLVWGLLLSAALVGYVNYLRIQTERAEATKTVNAEWQNQGDKNPHSAAHYGSFAYRPKSPLSFLDFGTDTYTGMSVRMEAHKQNDAVFSAAQESSSLIRFGELSTAFVLQVLMPLIIIFLCFGAFTQEKEDKTLQLLYSQGTSMQTLAWGKIWGYSGIVLCLVLPLLAVILALMFTQSEVAFSGAWLMRSGLLLLCYLAYLFGFVVVSVWVSAQAKTSRVALLSLLVLWVLACVIIPKTTVNLASNIYPVPSSFAFQQAIKEDEAKGIDGHNPEDERAEILKKQVLAQYKVDSLSQLPVNFDAIQMQEGEKYSSMVYQKHFTELQNTFNKQNKLSEIVGLVNPFLAIRQASMALSGSDYVSHADFQQQAEVYRFKLVETMNNYMRDNSKTGDWYFTVNKELWSKVPDFQFKEPSISKVLSNNSLALLALGIWVMVGVWGVSRIKFSM